MSRSTAADRQIPDQQISSGIADPRSGEDVTGTVAAPELLILDHAVPDGGMLAGMTARPCRPVQLAADADGLAALATVVQAFGPVSAVHLVGHGGPGRLAIGDRQITRESLARRSQAVAALAAALGGAPLLLYGCAVGAGAEGRGFVAALAAAVDAPVRAASTPIGAADLGGAWDLDVAAPAASHGASAAAPLFDAVGTAAWSHLLAATNWIGGTGDWSTPANWDNGVPAGSDEASIDNGGTAQVTSAAAVRILRIGDNGGTGALEVALGGTLTSGGWASLGWLPGASGTATVTGAGSTWTTVILTVGSDGAGTLTVSEGGTVATGELTLGSSALGASGTLNIGAGGTPGIVDTAEVAGGNGTATLNFDHTGGGYHFTTDGTVTGTAVKITGSTTVNHVGTGTTVLTGTNTYTGGTSVSAGTLSVGGGDNLGSGAVTLNGGTLAITGATTIDNDFILGPRHGTVTTDGTGRTVSGDISGAGRLIKEGAGTLTLTGSNTYDGDTWISDGTLSVADDDNLGDGTIVFYGGAMEITGDADIDNAFNIFGHITVSVDGADATLSGGISGSRNLTKNGPGTLTLAANDGRSGDTAVSAGTLKVDAALTSGANAVSVAAGATLGGNGSIAGDVTVDAGGRLAPGNDIGRLATGDLTLSAGATLAVEINGTTAGSLYDQVVVTGTVDLDGATLSTAFGFTSTTGDSIMLIDNDGSADAVGGTFADLAEGADFTTGGRIYRISYVAGDGNDVTLTDVGASAGVPGGGDSGPTDLSLTGSTAADALIGGDGSDTLWGLSGDDTLSGAGGTDLIYGNQDGDTLWGGKAADTAFGGQGADVVYGNQADDVIYGNRGDDTLYGGQHSDTVYGGQDADVLYGNLADDLLFGNLGSDVLYGGQGDDTLSGGPGNDFLVGGVGADRYAFGSGDGADTVGGFSAAEGDIIAVAADVNGSGADDLLARVSADADGNAVIDLGQGSLVTLLGVPPSSVSAAWFLVV